MSRLYILTKGEEIHYTYGLQKKARMIKDGWKEKMTIAGFNMCPTYIELEK